MEHIRINIEHYFNIYIYIYIIIIIFIFLMQRPHLKIQTTDG